MVSDGADARRPRTRDYAEVIDRMRADYSEALQFGSSHTVR